MMRLTVQSLRRMSQNSLFSLLLKRHERLEELIVKRIKGIFRRLLQQPCYPF